MSQPDQHYQALKQALERFKDNIQSDLEDVEGIANFLQMQAQQVALSDVLTQLDSRHRSYQTEINKELRLLQTDLTFLKAARQPKTIAQRQTRIGDRLQTLIGYCDALLQPGDQ